MRNFTRPDELHFQAAVGWLELGNFTEANAELEEITPELRAHPEVLKLRVPIYCKSRKWQMAATVTDTLVEILPTDADLWLHGSVALCQHDRMQEAHAALVITFELQPDPRRELRRQQFRGKRAR